MEIDYFVFVLFISHQRARPIIVDPGLYMNKKQDVFWVTQRRSRPTAFKLFTGKDSFSCLLGLCLLFLFYFSNFLMYMWLEIFFMFAYSGFLRF